MHVLYLGPKIPVGKSKYKCKYCNYAPKFQLIKVSTGVGIATKPQNSS